MTELPPLPAASSTKLVSSVAVSKFPPRYPPMCSSQTRILMFCSTRTLHALLVDTTCLVHEIPECWSKLNTEGLPIQTWGKGKFPNKINPNHNTPNAE